MRAAQSAPNGLYGVLGGVILLHGLGEFRPQAVESVVLRRQVAGAKFTLVEKFYIVPGLHSGVPLGVKGQNVLYNGHGSASLGTRIYIILTQREGFG